LRYVEPVSSVRTTFAYTNITHILAVRIIAKAQGAADWNAVLQSEILDPVSMKDTSYTPMAAPVYDGSSKVSLSEPK
jgi:CubicO group peptidase (beta-lactamase class C family)